MRMRTIMMTALIGCGALGVTGCSTDAAPAASSTSSIVATSPAPAPGTAATATPGTGVFGVTQSAACETDLQLVETQVQAYLALNGGNEVTESEIVDQGLGREPSTLHDIGPGASIVPAAGSGCAR